MQLAPELQARLAAYAWPGNLRQLSSALRTACALLADDETVLDWAHLPDDLVDALQAPVAYAAPVASTLPQEPQSLQALSQAAIQQALQAAHGNVSQAARTLGISRQTLYRKLSA